MRLRWNSWKGVSEGTGGPGAPVAALPWTQQRIATFISDPNGGIYNAAGTVYQWGPWAHVSQGSTRPGGAVTAVPYNQLIALFVADAGGGIYAAQGTPDAGYGPWTTVSQGSTTPGAPVTAIPYGSRIALFVADPNGGVYTTAGTPDTEWGPWGFVSEGRTTPGGAVTAVPYGSRIALFVADPSGGVYTTAGTPDTDWGPWAPVSAGSTLPGAPVTAVPFGQRIALFLADRNGGIHAAVGTPDAGWSRWERVRDGSTIPGGRISVIPLPWNDGVYAVFVTDPNGGIYWTAGTPPTDWQPWTLQNPRPQDALSPGAPLAPVPAYLQPGNRSTIALLTTASDGRVLYTNAQPPRSPSSLRVTGVSPHTIDVAWRGHADHDGFRIHYHGTRAGVADHDDTRTFDGDTEAASLTGLLSGYEYPIEIVAFNGIGDSNTPDPVTATVPIVPETVQLRMLRQQVIEGPVPYEAHYPEFGQVVPGHLLKITLPANSTPVVGLSLVHSTEHCGTTEAVVLGRGQSTTPEQMKKIYGVETPLYRSSNPIFVLACTAVSGPIGHIVDEVWIDVTIISDGT